MLHQSFFLLLIVFSETERILIADSTKWTPLSYGSEFGECLQGLPIQNFSVVDKTFSTLEERKVLMELYSTTNGETTWINKKNWNTSVPHCSWFGITCLNDTGYVIGINLMDNNLKGTHPVNLWRLRNLLGLCTGSNPQLTGDVSEIISSNMTKLIRVDIAFSHLKGEIPQHITQLKNLLKIQLCCQVGEGLTGEIPPEIGNLTNLLVLSLGENDLRGNIPKSLSKLSKLYFLDFEVLRNLKGSIDIFLNLTSLKGMHLTSAGIQGPLPIDFGLYFPHLEDCFLSGNNITGHIPPSFDKMKHLKQLKLAKGHLEGNVPNTIGKISSLKILDLSYNILTSLEENTTFYGPNLEIILLGNNNFSIPLTNFVQTLLPLNSSLRVLNVSSCGFRGSIPKDILSFKNIIYLDLKNNNLHGSLPSTHNPLPFLVYMDVSNNALTGMIPAQYVVFYALVFLDVSGNPKMSAPRTDNRKILQNFIKIDLSSFMKRNLSERFSCPNAILTFSGGRLFLDPEYYHFVFCACDNGYYGFSGNCKKCMAGAKCGDTQTGYLYPSTMTISAGHWPSPSYKNATHLQRCSSSQWISQKQLACNPSGACKCELNKLPGSSSQLYTRCREDCICHKGGTDRFCSKCVLEYYKRGSLCYRCEDYKLEWYEYVAILIMTILILWLALFYFRRRTKIAFIVVIGQVVCLAVLRFLELIPGWLFETHVITMLFTLSGRRNIPGGILKITVFYLQIVNALLSETDDIWPPYVIKTQYYISNVVSFHFSGLSCQLPYLFTPLGKLLFAFLFPIAIIVLVWVYYGVCYGWYWYRNDQGSFIRMKCNCLKLTVFCLNLTYFPVVKNSLSVLAPCGVDGSIRYMNIAPWIQCDRNNQAYLVMQVIGGLAAFVYGFMVPFVVFPVLLRKYYCKRDSMQPHERELLDSWLGLIYLPYRVDVRHYYEVVAVLRKLLLALMMAVVPFTSSYHAILVSLVLTAAMAISLSLSPYESSLRSFSVENVLDGLVLFVLLHSFMATRLAALDADSRLSLSWTIVIVNLILILVLVAVLLLFLSRRDRQNNPENQPIVEQNSDTSHSHNN